MKGHKKIETAKYRSSYPLPKVEPPSRSEVRLTNDQTRADYPTAIGSDSWSLYSVVTLSLSSLASKGHLSAFGLQSNFSNSTPNGSFSGFGVGPSSSLTLECVKMRQVQQQEQRISFLCWRILQATFGYSIVVALAGIQTVWDLTLVCRHKAKVPSHKCQTLAMLLN